LKHVQDLAKSRLGECLSSEYINSKTKMTFRCCNGHIFKTIFNLIDSKNTWCPKCNIFVGEEISRTILETMFGVKFNKIRLKCIDKLELDGYNTQLKLAFEYDGEQHHKFVKRFHKTRNKFLEQQERDRRKNRLCKENGINLIRIPYTVPKSDIQDHIIGECNKLEIDIPNDGYLDHTTFSDIYKGNTHRYEEIKEIVESKGLELISDSYIGAKDKIKVKCIAKGHTYEIIPYNILECKYCREVVTEKIRREKRLIYICNIAKQNGGKCTDIEYVNKKTRMNFECKKNHKFKITPTRLITNNAWCHSCKVGKRSIKEMHDFAKTHNGECLSDEYITLISPLDWKCENGHTFTQKPQSMIAKNNFCIKCKVNKKNIDRMKKIAEENNGQCLSTEYVNGSTELQWKCENDHIFMRRPEYIRKREFCLECKI
jgi:very-short-patch-repair endonuclease